MYLFGFKSKERYTYGGPCPVFTLRDLAIDFTKEYLEDITNTSISFNLLIFMLKCLHSMNSPIFVCNKLLVYSLNVVS